MACRAILAAGVAGPVVLLLGLLKTTASAASLLLNREAVVGDRRCTRRSDHRFFRVLPAKAACLSRPCQRENWTIDPISRNTDVARLFSMAE